MMYLPRRKLPVTAVIGLCLVVSALAIPAGRDRIRGMVYKNHRFPGRPLSTGQCTWYARQRAADFGWRIRFDVEYDRHARNWWRKVTNARRSTTPKRGAIMVLDSWDGNPYGHVAYVEHVRDPNHWTITHANYAVGTIVGWREGVPLFRVECERTPEGARLAGSAQTFRLKGFLLPE